jgi:hypothetical protein
MQTPYVPCAKSHVRYPLKMREFEVEVEVGVDGTQSSVGTLKSTFQW